jgi:hypothetical protein
MRAKEICAMAQPLIPAIIPFDPQQPASVVGLHVTATELMQRLT